MTLVPRDKPLVLQIDTNDNLPHGLAEANAITISSVIATTLSAYDYSGLSLSGLGDVSSPINPAPGQALIWDEGAHKWRPGTVGGGGGGGTPAGGPNEIQFNDGAGNFAADPGFTFTPATGGNPGTLEVPKIVVSEPNPPGVVVFGPDGSLSSVPLNDGEILVGVPGNIPGIVSPQSPLSVGGGGLSLGTVPVGKGGTGVSTFPAAGTILTGGTTLGSFTPANNSLVIKNNAGTLTSLAPGNSKLVSTDGTGQLTSISLPLPLGSGGTGQTTSTAALNALLPSQGGNSGKYLKTDGSNASWDTPAGGGGGGATAYGSVGQVQFNDGANGFYATNTFTFASGTNTLSVLNLSAESLDLGTALPLTEGGTGATNATAARGNLGLGTIATASMPLPIVSGGTGNTASIAANRIPFSDGSKLITANTLNYDPLYDSLTAGIMAATTFQGTTTYSTSYRVGNIITSNPLDLSSLNSVSQNLVANPSNGKVLTWSGTKWVASSIPQSPDFTSALSSLNDVSNPITPITGASLVWSGGAVNKWTAAVITGGGATTVAQLDDIGDVDVPTPSNTQVLRWNGSKWVADFVIPSYTVVVPPGGGGAPEQSRLVISDGSGSLSSVSGVGFTSDLSSIFVSGHIVTPTLLTNIIQTTDGNANTIFFAPGTHALEISPDPLSNNGKLGITGNTIVEGNLEVVGNYGVGYVSANNFIKSDKYVYAPNVSASVVSATTYKNLPPSVASAVGTYTEFQFRNPAGGLSSDGGIYYDPTTYALYANNLQSPWIIATDIVGATTNNYFAFDDGTNHASTFYLDTAAADGKLAIVGNGLLVSGNIQSNKYLTAPIVSGTTLSGTNLSALNLSATLGKLLNLSATNVSSISLKSTTVSAASYLNLPTNYTTLNAETFSATSYLNLPTNYTTLSAGTFSATTYLNLPATPTALSSLTDVGDTVPSINQALVWDGSYWIPSSIPAQIIPNSYTTLSAGTFSATNYLNLPASATVFGSNSEIQFRGPGSVFSGTSQLTWNSSASSLSSTNIYVGSAIQLNITATPTLAVGQMSWNSTDQTLDIQTTVDTTLQVGQEQVMLVENKSGASIASGKVVYVSGTTGGSGKLNVALASASSTNSESAFIIGVTTQAIADNSTGFVTTFGKISGIPLPTSAFNDGDIAYLGNTPGELRNYRPSKPAHGHFQMGRVIRAHNSNGILFVTIRGSVDMDEIHDVASGTPSNNQTLVYNSTSGLYVPTNYALSALSDVSNTLNPSNGKVLTWSGSKWIASSIPLLAGGSNTQVQFNSNGYLAGNAGFTYTSATQTLVAGAVQAGTNYTDLIAGVSVAGNNINLVGDTHAIEITPDPTQGDGKVGVLGNFYADNINTSIFGGSVNSAYIVATTNVQTPYLFGGTVSSTNLIFDTGSFNDLSGNEIYALTRVATPLINTTTNSNSINLDNAESAILVTPDPTRSGGRVRIEGDVIVSSLYAMGDFAAYPEAGALIAKNQVSSNIVYGNILSSNYVFSNDIQGNSVSAENWQNIAPGSINGLVFKTSTGNLSASPHAYFQPSSNILVVTGPLYTSDNLYGFRSSFDVISSLNLVTQNSLNTNSVNFTPATYAMTLTPDSTYGNGEFAVLGKQYISGQLRTAGTQIFTQVSGLNTSSRVTAAQVSSTSVTATNVTATNGLTISNGDVNALASNIYASRGAFDVVSSLSIVTRDNLNTNTLDFVPATYAIKLTPDATYGTGEFAVQGKQYISGQLRTVGTHYFSNTSGTSTASRVTVAQVSSTTVTGINLSSTSLSATSIIATNGLYTGLSSTNFSATNYINLPVSSLSGLRDVSSPMNPSNGQVLTWSSTRWIASSVAAGGTPGGANTQVQFNNNGSFSGVSNFTYDNNTTILTVPAVSATTYYNLSSSFYGTVYAVVNGFVTM